MGPLARPVHGMGAVGRFLRDQGRLGPCRVGGRGAPRELFKRGPTDKKPAFWMVPAIGWAIPGRLRLPFF